ncbi:GNAT family N-acetyltransferase [Ornithinibacillus sp. JPR2-1]|uniref:GNAT family N-acetyltransferase n=1 Tax=Ornithinibacillus sp. JPR2-1 TaxID=2094019 RepID=UPI0031DFECAD
MLITLKTERLILRQFTIDDATRVQELAGNKDVSKTTLGIPHPYPLEAAKQWIENHPKMMKNDIFPFAIVLKAEDILIGTMTIRINDTHKKAELAYWIGKEYWGNGYATEAAKEIVRYGFEDLNLNRIWAKAMSKNPASSKVMINVGMKKEGVLKEDILKSGVFEHSDIYGLTRSGYQ